MEFNPPKFPMKDELKKTIDMGIEKLRKSGKLQEILNIYLK